MCASTDPRAWYTTVTQEPAILTPFKPAPGTIPPDSRLESTAIHLENQADWRSLVCLADKWSEVGEATPRARLAFARAFYHLRLMDRAWLRLRDLAEASNPSRDALVLASRLFLERGWPLRARPYLEHAREADPGDLEVEALFDRLSEPPVHPDPAAVEDAPPANARAWLPLAEVYMATGSYIKAASILERLQKHNPDYPRIADLIWALEGDFTLPGTLSELAQRLGPNLSVLADLGDEPEHTEAFEKGDIPELRDDPEQRFPSLFRQVGVAEPPEVPPDEEVTVAASSATLAELQDPPPHDPDAPRPPAQSGDTQIVRVIHKVTGQDGLAPSDGPIHSNVPEDPASPFDLGNFRREMGMSPPSDFDDLEDEDEDLIIVTRREDEGEPDYPSLDLDPTTASELQRAVRREVAASAEAPPVQRTPRPRKPRPRKPRQKPSEEALPPPPPPRRRSHPSMTRWWVLVASALVTLLVGLVVLAVVARLLLG